MALGLEGTPLPRRSAGRQSVESSLEGAQPILLGHARHDLQFAIHRQAGQVPVKSYGDTCKELYL